MSHTQDLVSARHNSPTGFQPRNENRSASALLAAAGAADAGIAAASSPEDLAWIENAWLIRAANHSSPKALRAYCVCMQEIVEDTGCSQASTSRATGSGGACGREAARRPVRRSRRSTAFNHHRMVMDKLLRSTSPSARSSCRKSSSTAPFGVGEHDPAGRPCRAPAPRRWRRRRRPRPMRGRCC